MSIFEYDKEIEEKKLREAEFEAGKQAGIRLGIASTLLSFLSELGNVPNSLKDKILQEKNIEILQSWSKIAVKAETIEDFLSQING